ncbi:MAG: ATP synthase F0 subunit B [Deltaproteobacteria bacterium]|nr:ATP synthase F0 subunit B [Deltaproteobacteria bacterium]
MKRLKTIVTLIIFVIIAGFSLQSFAAEAVAGDTAHSWRPTYDLVMRWLNFIILVFLLIKFGKNPLMNLLRQRKGELQREINRAEEQKNKAQARVKETRKLLDESVVRLEDRKEKIIKLGENRKQEIIRDGQRASKLLLQEAKRRIDAQVLSAKKTFRAEMIDEAMKIVFKRLPPQISDEDNQKLLNQYFARVASM